MKPTTIVRLSVLSMWTLVAACDAEPESPTAPRVATDVVADLDSEPAVALAPAATPKAGHAKAAPMRTAPMPGAKQAFEKVTELVAEQYVGGALSEDEVWTGAIDGVLGRLPQRGDHPINVLMSPAEFDELIVGTKGKLVGVGIMIERVADVIVIKDVVADGPASRAGIQAGDRILGVDGARVRALELAEVVQRIRGAEGTEVALFVQRDTEEWTATVTRGQIHVDSVQSAILGDHMGYVRITSFAKDTASELDEHLSHLRADGVTRIVLDLRDCPGGLLDATVGLAERFLAPGATVLTIEARNGKTEAVVTADDHRGGELGLVVLIGPGTASSAEILADALRHHGRATLVGDASFGKHTIESVHELGGGWAVKLSVSRFITASGAAADGEAVRPDIRIPADPERKMAPVTALVPDDDPTLATAMELLDRR